MLTCTKQEKKSACIATVTSLIQARVVSSYCIRTCVPWRMRWNAERSVRYAQAHGNEKIVNLP